MRRAALYLLLLAIACGDAGATLGLGTGDGGLVGARGGPMPSSSSQSELRDAGPRVPAYSVDRPQKERSRPLSSVLPLAAFPKTLTLPTAPVDCPSGWQAFYVENVGHAPVEIETIRAVNDTLEVDTDRSPPFVLYPADPFYIRVRAVAPSTEPVISAIAIDGLFDQRRGWLDVPVHYQADPWLPRTDSFRLDRTPAENIVFVISSAPSMAQEQDNLRTNLAFWAASPVGARTRVAVTTMDLAHGGGDFMTDIRGDEPWLLSTDPAFADRFVERALVGATGGPFTEAKAALFTLLGRPEALAMMTHDYGLNLVFIMDTDDHSLLTDEQYSEFVQALPKSGAGGFAVNGGVAGCRTPNAHALPAPRLNGGDTRWQLDFCSSDWGRALNIPARSNRPNREFLLSGEPAGGHVIVQVDGQYVPAVDAAGRRRWSLPRLDTLLFTDAVAIDAPQDLSVSYTDAACFH